MTSLRRHVLLSYLGNFAAQGLAQSDRVLDPLIRAAYWEATTIDEYIYIDGGQVSLDLPEEEGLQRFTWDTTLSIDCRDSWTPEDVDIRVIDRLDQIPALSNQCIFTTENAFTIWGGGGGESTGPLRLWEFTADGEGGGRWESLGVGNADVFGDIPYRASAACANTDERAFAFGGAVPSEQGGQREDQATTGLVTFDLATRTFEEQEEGEGYEGNYSGDGSVWGGTATFVPNFGAEGVIIMIGGESNRNESGAALRDMETVSIYDVAGRRWYSQKATTSGDRTEPPRPRTQHCAVGVADTGTRAGNDSSFEIFIYGGASSSQRAKYGDMYALSLPGFTWTNVTDVRDGDARLHHACVNVNGSSLLVSLGGIGLFGSANETWLEPDPFPNGIGIFDMNQLGWVDSYDPGAGSYVTNDRIRAWYDDGGLDTIEWSEGVRDLFIRNRTTSVGDNDSPPGGGGDDDEGEEEDTSSSTPTGAIAGGVVGGLVGLAVVAGVVWWFWRQRRRRNNNLNIQPYPVPTPTEMSTTTPKPTSASVWPPSEMASNTNGPYAAEMDTSTSGAYRPVSELDGSGIRR